MLEVDLRIIRNGGPLEATYIMRTRKSLEQGCLHISNVWTSRGIFLASSLFTFVMFLRSSGHQVHLCAQCVQVFSVYPYTLDLIKKKTKSRDQTMCKFENLPLYFFLILAFPSSNTKR